MTVNSKVPGVDGITNFSLKRLHTTYKNMAAAYKEMVNDEQSIQWNIEDRRQIVCII